MRKMTVTPYNEAWVHQFSQEAKILRGLFGDELLEIHHIGSTAVPGLKAKPIIDMLPVVKDIERIDSYHEAMRQLGYVPRGEFGLEGRRYFPKGGDNRTHHVHIYQTGHPAIDRHLAFRDYLRSHPEVAKAYGTLKEGLALRYPHDPAAYVNGKEAWVLTTEKVALEWFTAQ
ncbi:GrpB family protein [Brevibacillus reuszeri]|uniref:GrpB family protein n=1 Tax=Brevibacillus reuszeri TaxID=54915 RepID=UPI00289DDE4D|nr:GrpB family protein [Brevibacillus reuszeri]